MIKIHLIAGARPNFMKIAPLYAELIKNPIFDISLIHTGQHYDYNLSGVFFKEFSLPPPNYYLEIGKASPAQQIGKIMMSYESIIQKSRPDLIIVVGDVNSTIACGFVGKQQGCLVAHLEAGLRSFDRTMPEEINRVMTDGIADILWTPSEDADINLQNEGIACEKISRVGNIMIDTLLRFKSKIDANTVIKDLKLPGKFAVVTIHRPSNTDNENSLLSILETFGSLSNSCPLVFPIHPRTKNALQKFKLWERLKSNDAIHLHEPLSYVPFLSLLQKASFIVTDSGGVQEETSFLNIPCLTLRQNTERPITCTNGTNELCTTDNLTNLVAKVLRNQWKQRSDLPLWDGRTAERTCQDICDRLGISYAN